MMITAHHGHDLQETSCVNMEIEVLNRKLRTMMKIAESVKIIQANVCRNDVTLHELHLNISGKEMLAELKRKDIKKTKGKKIRNLHHSEIGRKCHGSYSERSQRKINKR